MSGGEVLGELSLFWFITWRRTIGENSDHSLQTENRNIFVYQKHKYQQYYICRMKFKTQKYRWSSTYVNIRFPVATLFESWRKSELSYDYML